MEPDYKKMLEALLVSVWKWSGVANTPAIGEREIFNLGRDMFMEHRRITDALKAAESKEDPKPPKEDPKPKKRGPGRPRKNPKPDEGEK